MSRGAGRAASVTAALLLLGAAAAIWLWRGKPPPLPPPPPPPTAPAPAPPLADAAVADALTDARRRVIEPPDEADDAVPDTLEAQRERLLRRIAAWHDPPPEALERLRATIEASSLLGQGNPAATRHPMTRAECRERRAKAAGGVPGDPRCGAPNMVPLGPDASACIDQYEFPNIPCEYPVVYARANEAARMCQALGKRLCDAHEWEGACAGAVRPIDEEYDFGKPRNLQSYLHNKARDKVWAYGPKKDHAVCATASKKSDDCNAGGWKECGSNTYPAGAFLDCKSSLGVYDLHGNAAEHMNLPLVAEELSSRGGSGVTEMKGSWFIFLRGEAHEDDCRWRAPSWHETRVMAEDSHRNYHLGFRCCKDRGTRATPPR